jgi:hypothetical protein
MRLELAAFLSVFCLLSLIVRLNGMAYLFGLGAAGLIAVGFVTTHFAGRLPRSKMH